VWWWNTPWEGRTGAAVAVEVVTGEILAAPEIDLAAHLVAWPGSPVKSFVLMALLESGKLNASQRLQCRRPLRIGGVRMDCSHPASVVDWDAEPAGTMWESSPCTNQFWLSTAKTVGQRRHRNWRFSGWSAPRQTLHRERHPYPQTASARLPCSMPSQCNINGLLYYFCLTLARH
jgi:hypothetical protein